MALAVGSGVSGSIVKVLVLFCPSESFPIDGEDINEGLDPKHIYLVLQAFFGYSEGKHSIHSQQW